MPNTIAQRRSSFALQVILTIRNGMTDKEKDELAKLFSGLPAMILQNGFGQTLAFLLAKGTNKGRFTESDKYIRAFDAVTSWLVARGVLQENERSGFVTYLSTMDQSDYLRAQDEALLVIDWLKRYSNSGLF